MKTPKKFSGLLYAFGPLAAVLCFITAQQAMATTSQNEALLYALLATFFATVLLGWALYFGIIIYFHIKDKK